MDLNFDYLFLIELHLKDFVILIVILLLIFKMIFIFHLDFSILQMNFILVIEEIYFTVQNLLLMNFLTDCDFMIYYSVFVMILIFSI